MTNVSFPIFPLPVFLLPAGKMRLRVFEAKYIKLISIASVKGGFIIQPRPTLGRDGTVNGGSLVEVHDFNQGKDGILEVDVYCRSLVDIKSIVSEGDLTFGTIEMLTHWSQEARHSDSSLKELASTLNGIIIDDIMLNSLYQEKLLTNEAWVIARWLELLPITLTVKNTFINGDNFTHAKELVESIVYNKTGK